MGHTAMTRSPMGPHWLGHSPPRETPERSPRIFSRPSECGFESTSDDRPTPMGGVLRLKPEEEVDTYSLFTTSYLSTTEKFTSTTNHPPCFAFHVIHAELRPHLPRAESLPHSTASIQLEGYHTLPSPCSTHTHSGRVAPRIAERATRRAAAAPQQA